MKSTTHFKVVWHQSDTSEPAVIYVEIDEERMETRKVHRFADGRTERADRAHSTEMTELSYLPTPPADKIRSQEEFEYTDITPEEFEDAWNNATLLPRQ